VVYLPVGQCFSQQLRGDPQEREALKSQRSKVFRRYVVVTLAHFGKAAVGKAALGTPSHDQAQESTTLTGVTGNHRPLTATGEAGRIVGFDPVGGWIAQSLVSVPSYGDLPAGLAFGSALSQ
jgi:hypothetical protein